MTAVGTNKLVDEGDKTEIFNLLRIYELVLPPGGLANNKGFLLGSWFKRI